MLPILIPAHLSVFVPCQINTADKASREGEEKGEGEGEGRGKTVAAALCLKFNIVVVILRDSPSTEGHTHMYVHTYVHMYTPQMYLSALLHIS